MRTKSEPRELELDVVRGFAILLAVGWHFNTPLTGIAAFDVLLLPGARFGWAGVDLFFVLSGFLIGRLIFQELERNQKFNYKRFLLRRIFRLWPTLYLFLLAQLLLGDHEWRSYFFQNLFHVQNYLGSSISHLWSLAVEEHFYLVFGVLCFIFGGKIAGVGTPTVLLSLVLICPILRYMAAHAGWDRIAIQQQTQFRLDELACGVLLAYLFVYRAAVFEKLLRPRYAWLALCLVGCVFLFNSQRIGDLEEALVYSVALLTSVAFILFIYRHPMILRLPRASALMAFLGFYSYTLYVWQFTGFRIAARIAKHAAWLNGPVCIVLLKYAASILVAVVVTRSIERPFMALRDRIMGSKSRQVVTLAPGSASDQPTGN